MSMDAINKGEVMATEEVKVDEGDSHELVFDSKEFAAMLRELKGEKPIREFAIETDLSESYLSKAVNGLVPSRPTKKTLAKLLDAVTDSKISRSDFLRAAGYSGVELTGRRVAATVGALNQLYGVDHFTAMGDFMRALATHGVNGDMASYFHRDAGYVEVTDQDTGQVYVCINGYVRPDEGEAVPIAFGVGITYAGILSTDGAKDKIVYILTDDGDVYDGCRSALTKNRVKATVIVYTDHQRGFRKEEVIAGSSDGLLSLVG